MLVNILSLYDRPLRISVPAGLILEIIAYKREAFQAVEYVRFQRSHKDVPVHTFPQFHTVNEELRWPRDCRFMKTA